MNAAYLHLLVNHFPVVLSVVGAGMILLAVFMRRPAFWRFGLTCLLLAGIAAIPVYFTGRSAGGIMEKMWYVTRESVHDHEEAGELALWVLLGVGLVSGYTLWRTSTRPAPGVTAFPGWLQTLAVLGALAAAIFAGYAAYEGGKIVHESPRLANPLGGNVRLVPGDTTPQSPR